MKCVLAFLIGAVVGAAIALLLAPSSGEELRARLSQEAAAKRQQLEADYEKVRQGVHEHVDKMQHQGPEANGEGGGQTETGEAA